MHVILKQDGGQDGGKIFVFPITFEPLSCGKVNVYRDGSVKIMELGLKYLMKLSRETVGKLVYFPVMYQNIEIALCTKKAEFEDLVKHLVKVLHEMRKSLKSVDHLLKGAKLLANRNRHPKHRLAECSLFLKDEENSLVQPDTSYLYQKNPN